MPHPSPFPNAAPLRASRPVTVEGRFVGVIVLRQADWFFRATDPLLGGLEGAAFASPDAAERGARQVLLRGGARAGAHAGAPVGTGAR